MILELLEGVTTMKKGEVAMFKMKPELHYGEDDCPVSVSDNFPKEAELHFEIEMIDFSKVKIYKAVCLVNSCSSEPVDNCFPQTLHGRRCCRLVYCQFGGVLH